MQSRRAGDGEDFKQVRGEHLASVGVFDDLVHGGDVGVGELGACLAQRFAQLRNNLRERALGADGEVHGNAFEVGVEAGARIHLRRTDFKFRQGGVTYCALTEVVEDAYNGRHFFPFLMAETQDFHAENFAQVLASGP